MGIDEVLKERLAIVEAGENKAEARMKEAQRLLKMPFHLRIQEKSMKRELEQIHETQKWTFEKICKKEKIHKKDWEDEFCLFWIGFLKGEYKSINQYLKIKNFKK